MDLMITVFTPTYDRAYTLSKAFESLKRQTYKDFEWLVVDDGSKDNTKEVIESFKAQRPFFDVVYVYKENGGKHTAMNLAGDHARGDVLVVLDSDDWLTDDALERMMRRYEDIKDESKIAAVIGRRTIYNRDELIKENGKKFDCVDIPYHKKGENGITGEDAFAFKTDVYKKYKFPVIEGEKYMAESVQLNEMFFDGYLFRFVNEIYMYGSYLEDGLTYDYKKVNHKYPRGYALWRLQEARLCEPSKKNMIRIYLDYRYELMYKYSDKEIARFLNIPYLYLKSLILLYKLKKRKKVNK